MTVYFNTPSLFHRVASVPHGNRMNSCFFLLSALLCIIMGTCLIACDNGGGSSTSAGDTSSPDTGTETTNYPNPYLTFGNYWLYDDQSFQYIEGTVTYNNVSYIQIMEDDGFQLLNPQTGAVEYMYAPDYGLVGLYPGMPVDLSRMVNLNATGTVYVGNWYYYDSEQNVPIRLVGKMEGREDVSTPAGDFTDCYKIVLDFYLSDEVEPFSSMTSWEKPGQGTVKTLDRDGKLIMLQEAKLDTEIIAQSSPQGVESILVDFGDAFNQNLNEITNLKVTGFDLGDSWSYENDLNMEVTGKVERNGRNLYLLRYLISSSDNYYEIYDPETALFYYTSGDVEGEVKIDPPVYNLEFVKSFSLTTAGDYYAYSATYSGSGEQAELIYEQTGSFSLLKYEDVKTPAGVFKNCKKIRSQYESYYEDGTFKEKTSFLFWHAEGVGTVRETYNGSSIQLLKATVGGVTYGADDDATMGESTQTLKRP